MKKTGKFVVVEGFDGTGKSTVIGNLKKLYPGAIFVKEPGTTPFGKNMRKMLKSGRYNLDHYSEKLLFTASMVETSLKVIKPALAKGQLVFADRWFNSTFAYQFYGHGEPHGVMHDIYKWCGVAIPDTTIIMDLPFKDCLKRQGNAGRGAKDKFESSKISYLKKVYEYYTICPGRRVDASEPSMEIAKEIAHICAKGKR